MPNYSKRRIKQVFGWGGLSIILLGSVVLRLGFPTQPKLELSNYSIVSTNGVDQVTAKYLAGLARLEFSTDQEMQSKEWEVGCFRLTRALTYNIWREDGTNWVEDNDLIFGEADENRLVLYAAKLTNNWKLEILTWMKLRVERSGEDYELIGQTNSWFMEELGASENHF